MVPYFESWLLDSVDSNNNDQDNDNNDNKKHSSRIDLYDALVQSSRQFIRNRVDRNIICSKCGNSIVTHPIYRCPQCNYNALCATCEAILDHDRSHVTIIQMSQYFPFNISSHDKRFLPQWPLAAPSEFRRTHTFADLSPMVFKDLVVGTAMPSHECEGLFHSFTLMADTSMQLTSVCEYTFRDKSVSLKKAFIYWFVRDTADNNQLPILPGVSRKTFVLMLPTASTGDEYLESIYFNMYDLHGDGIVDFYEFVITNISLFYSPEYVRVARLLRAVQQTEGFVLSENSKKEYWLVQECRMTPEVVVNALRRVLYGYYDVSRAMFADSSNLMAAVAEFGQDRPEVKHTPRNNIIDIIEGGNQAIDTRASTINAGDALGTEAMIRLAHTRRVEQLLDLLSEALEEIPNLPKTKIGALAKTIRGRVPQMFQWLRAVAEVGVL